MLMLVVAVGAVLELSSEKLPDSTSLPLQTQDVEGLVLYWAKLLLTPVAGYCGLVPQHWTI